MTHEDNKAIDEHASIRRQKGGKMKRPDTLKLPELHAIAVKTGMTAEDIGKLIKDWRQV